MITILNSKRCAHNLPMSRCMKQTRLPMNGATPMESYLRLRGWIGRFSNLHVKPLSISVMQTIIKTQKRVITPQEKRSPSLVVKAMQHLEPLPLQTPTQAKHFQPMSPVNTVPVSVRSTGSIRQPCFQAPCLLATVQVQSLHRLRDVKVLRSTSNLAHTVTNTPLLLQVHLHSMNPLRRRRPLPFEPSSRSYFGTAMQV